MNNDNAKSFDNAIDNISVETPEELEHDLRNNIFSNVSVPEASGTRVMNVESNPFNEV